MFILLFLTTRINYKHSSFVRPNVNKRGEICKNIHLKVLSDLFYLAQTFFR